MSKKHRIKFTPKRMTPNIVSTCTDITPIDYDTAAALEIDFIKHFVDASSARKATVLEVHGKELDEYCQMMEDRGQTSWEIGWESLPKYIAHKIYNRNTGEIATVMWDTKCGPCLFSESGKHIACCAGDFRHGNAYWIYTIGEVYPMSESL